MVSNSRVDITDNAQENEWDVDLVVVGAGVAGLVSASALTNMGLRVVVLERRASAQVAETGADLALWPGAITILKELGVPELFFKEECFELHTVHMCNMDFDSVPDVPPKATVLTTLDMKVVTNGTGEHFVLLSRQALMTRLRALADGLVTYGATVSRIEEISGGARVHFECDGAASSLKSRVVLGCDGARSAVRKHIAPNAPLIRFCGEVVHRGVLRVDGESENIRALLPDEADAHMMRINYGAGLRSSFGYMNGDGTLAYWWVKQPATEMPVERTKAAAVAAAVDAGWPKPLRTLLDATPDNSYYVHAVEDSVPLERWSDGHVALVGDAAHVVTPNMGQGACLAVEDAFVLCARLRADWNDVDVAVSFEHYEEVRKPYAEQVASEARKQLFLGQLRSRIAVYLREFILRNIPTRILVNKLKANNFSVTEFVDSYRKHKKET